MLKKVSKVSKIFLSLVMVVFLVAPIGTLAHTHDESCDHSHDVINHVHDESCDHASDMAFSVSANILAAAVTVAAYLDVNDVPDYILDAILEAFGDDFDLASMHIWELNESDIPGELLTMMASSDDIFQTLWGPCNGINIFTTTHSVSTRFLGSFILHHPNCGIDVCRIEEWTEHFCTRWGCSASTVLANVLNRFICQR
jgi:hypothetical protein